MFKPVNLIWRTTLNFRTRERSKIIVEKQRIITGLQISRKHWRGRRVLHHNIDCSANSVAFQIGCHRLVHFQPVEQIGREYVERDKTILIVGTRDFNAIDQRIIIAFIHPSENCILAFSRIVAFHRHPRHAAYDICHRLVVGQFNRACAHHIHDIDRFSLQQ